MPGAKRARSLACKRQKARKQVTTVAPDHPAFPHANGFNGLWRAPPAIASAMRSLVATRDASVEASGPHAFAVRKHTPSSLGVVHVHRIPAQRLVTTAKRPSYRAGTARSSRDDLPVGEREIFSTTGLDIAARQSRE